MPKQKKLSFEESLKYAKANGAVVHVKWCGSHEHVYTLEDGTKLTVDMLRGVGWDEENHRCPIVIINGERYFNRIPREVKDKWVAKHHEWLEKIYTGEHKAELDSDNKLGSKKSSSSVTFSQEKHAMATKEKTAKVEPVTFKKDRMIALFEAMEYTTAAKWTDKRWQDKIAAMPALVEGEEVPALEDKQLKKLLDKVVEAVKSGAKIVLQGNEGDEEEAEEEAEEKPAKKKAKAAKEEEADEDEEDDDTDDEDDDTDDEDEDDEEEEKPAKAEKKKDKGGDTKAEKKKAAKEKDEDEDEEDEDEKVPVKTKKAPIKAGKKGPGVINTIVKILRGASEKKPISKDKILEKLVEAFPDRPADGMKRTIGVQIPSGLKTGKSLIVQKNDKGYWLPPEKE